MMRVLLAVALVLCIPHLPADAAVVLVSDAKPAAVICIAPESPEQVRTAAEEIAAYVEKMSGARLEIRVTDPSPRDQAAILVGELAVKSGLRVGGPAPSREAYAIRTIGRRVLIGGESPIATLFAAYHFLETLGCRWFMEGDLGEVVPSASTVKTGNLNIREQPDFDNRRMWGSEWTRESRWKIANRCGGLEFAVGHAWAGLVPEESYFAEHPEYYSLIDGERRPRQLCTSNPAVAEIAANTVLERFRGTASRAGASLSPNDGGGFCTCEECRKLDVPDYIEPSSGAVCLSDRVQVFYNDVARMVAEEFPDRILSFYAYANYTLPPKRERKLEPNLMVWVAPIRHCRIHGIGSPICESRARLGKLIEEWSEIAPRIGYRTYNFNLAECIAPYSKLTSLKLEVPFLKAHKCTGIDNETLYSPAINGPHIYLSARLAWDADADVDAVMRDYYDKFFGKAAAPVEIYWERIDRAYSETEAHEGGFYCLPRIFTPELLAACDGDLFEAERAAKEDSTAVQERVNMFRRGFESVRLFMRMNSDFNAADFARAGEAYDELFAHAESMVADKILNRYGVEYLRRFIGPKVSGGRNTRTEGNRIEVKLPDEWLFLYDPDDEGESEGFWKSGADLGSWRRVKTFSATLEEQGIPAPSGIMWYAADFDAPADISGKDLRLWMSDVHGVSRVWVNGTLAGEGQRPGSPFEVAAGGLIRPGERNTMVIRVDHRQLVELSVAGIVGPGVIYSSAGGG